MSKLAISLLFSHLTGWVIFKGGKKAAQQLNKGSWKGDFCQEALIPFLFWGDWDFLYLAIHMIFSGGFNFLFVKWER